MQRANSTSALGAYDPNQLTVGTDTCTLSRPTTGPFSLPACGTDGNVGRNSYRGPHYFGHEMAIAKNFIITERIRMQFRMGMDGGTFCGALRYHLRL